MGTTASPSGHPRRPWPNCAFPSSGGPVFKTGAAALFHPPVVRSSVKTALVIGTVLVLINHLSTLLEGRLTPTVAAESLLTYLVPYAVSTYGAVSVSMVKGDSQAPEGRKRG